MIEILVIYSEILILYDFGVTLAPHAAPRPNFMHQLNQQRPDREGSLALR